MRNRESLDISIKDFLSLPPADTARFHSGNSLEFLFCRFLANPKDESQAQIEQNSKLFELALRSELPFCDLKDSATVFFFTQVLPYTIAMTTKGEEKDALMRVLVENVPSLANKIDLARIDFVLSGTITERLIATNKSAYSMISIPFNSVISKSTRKSYVYEDEQDSLDFEADARLVEAYEQDLESDDTFSRFIRLCADEITLPISDDDRYLEAVAKFVESINLEQAPGNYVLDFVVDQVASTQHFFGDRLNYFQFIKLKHLYLRSLISDAVKETDQDYERDSDTELFLGLDELSKEDLIWINNACQEDARSSLPPPPSSEILSLAAAHKIFLADKAWWEPDPLSKKILPDPLLHPVFYDLQPGQLLERLGISSPDKIRSFYVAWGRKSFGTLVKALDSSWYTGGIANDTNDLNKFNQELLKVAFEEAMRRVDDPSPTDLTVEFLTRKAHAKPKAEWLANGVSETFSDQSLLPGELGISWSNQISLFADIQRKLDGISGTRQTTGANKEKDTNTNANNFIHILSGSLRQRGLDIAPEELQSWLRQTLVDSLGDWTRIEKRAKGGPSDLSLAKDFVGISELKLSSWDVDSILSRYFALSTPSQWIKNRPHEVPEYISDYCNDLKEIAPDLSALNAVNRLAVLLCGHPYTNRLSGSADPFAHLRLLKLAKSFDINIDEEDSIKAARTAIRSSFLELCDSLNEQTNLSSFHESNKVYESPASCLVETLLNIEELNGWQISTMDLFDDNDLINELESVAKVLLPSKRRPDLVVKRFMIGCGKVFRGLA